MIVYAISTHWRLLSDTCSEFLIVGSATVTIVPSRTVMKNATHTSASASQRRGSGSESGGVDVPGVLIVLALPRQRVTCQSPVSQ